MKKILHFMLFVFAIGTTNAQTPIYEFNFDNTMANSFGSGSISPWSEVNLGGLNSVSYVVDRNGQANSAINIPATSSFTANAPLLPQSNAARSISFWVKFIGDTDNKNFPVTGWGTGNPNQAFGFWRTGIQNSYYTWGSGNDYNVPQTNAQIQANNNGWVHIAITYTGTTLSIFFNGVDAGNYQRTLNTTGVTLSLNRLVNGSVGNATATQIDDLKIYDTALTTAQVLNLYNPNASGNPPVISNVSNSSPTSNSAFVNFSLNPGGTTTTTSIVVTPLDGGIGSVFNGPTASGSTTQQLSYNITGLNPASCYTYRVEASNSAVSLVQSPIEMFCTNDANFNKTPIYHFEFNGNTQEKRDASLAFGNPNSGFVNNNTAIRLNNNVQALNLPFLPQGFKPRTVAIRVFFESGALSQTNNVFSYGTATPSQSFGYDQETASQANHYYWSNDNIFSNPVNFGTYYTMVFVYDGLDTRIYKDGFQVDISSNTPNTVGTLFRLGRTTTGLGGFFNGRVDDLRIYNDTLSATEVAVLTNSLSNNDFSNNLNFSLYPNPANSIVNINLEAELKSVEIYSLQGQKVISTTEKQVNVSSLSKGIYLIEVTDVNNQKAVQKLIVE